jgi:tetratricopeptide (TPR) repeat protein
MDNSNQDGTVSSGRMGLFDKKKLRLCLVLMCPAAVLALRAWTSWRSQTEAKASITDYDVFMAAVHRADDIADPLRRCLNYPDPPGSDWNKETTAAYCQLLNRDSLQLSQIDALLQQGKADEVDRAFQGYLDAQLHDASQQGAVDEAMHQAGFDTAKTETRKIIDKWKQLAPNSAFALAASGMQYLQAAQEARGTGWSDEVNDSQVMDMHQLLELARQNLARAVALQPAITPAYTSMIYAGALEGDVDYMDQAAKHGVAVDSANFRMRVQMMNQAQPKWGSAFGGEREQLGEVEPLIPGHPLLRMVANAPAAYRLTSADRRRSTEIEQQIRRAAAGNVTQFRLTDLADEAYNIGAYRLATELYSEVLRFHPTDMDALVWRDYSMRKFGDVDDSIKSMVRAAQRFPDDNAIGSQLGKVYMYTRHVKEAEAAFLTVIKRDPYNLDALGGLGDLYNHAGHQPDKAEAIADTLISHYPENAAGYIIRSCNQMDHNLPGRYETIHYFIDHFGSMPDYKQQTDEMRAYLVSHPEQPGVW